MSKTIHRFITIPLEEVRSKNYYDNIERYGDHADTCFICGKRVKDKNPSHLHYLTTGEIVSYGGDDIKESQGFFPVGRDCAKKLVIEFTWK